VGAGLGAFEMLGLCLVFGGPVNHERRNRMTDQAGRDLMHLLGPLSQLPRGYWDLRADAKHRSSFGVLSDQLLPTRPPFDRSRKRALPGVAAGPDS
jgi:hypothetical protein